MFRFPLAVESLKYFFKHLYLSFYFWDHAKESFIENFSLVKIVFATWLCCNLKPNALAETLKPGIFQQMQILNSVDLSPYKQHK